MITFSSPVCVRFFQFFFNFSNLVQCFLDLNFAKNFKEFLRYQKMFYLMWRLKLSLAVCRNTSQMYLLFALCQIWSILIYSPFRQSVLFGKYSSLIRRLWFGMNQFVIIIYIYLTVYSDISLKGPQMSKWWPF